MTQADQRAQTVIAHLNGTRSVVAERRPPGTSKVIEYVASNIKRERTGIHARMDILVNRVNMAWSSVNIERDEERVRLANKAAKEFGELAALWPANYVSKDLADFADQIYPVWLTQYSPGLMAGTKERSAPSAVIENLLLEGSGTIIYAPPGRGKSYVIHLAAVSCEHGINQIFHIPRPAHALYINLERHVESMRRRLGNVNAALGLDRDTPLPFLNARGKGLADVYESIEQYIREQGVEVVFLDSISRAGYAGSLTEDVTGNRIADALNNLGIAWVAVAHTPRSDESHEYGTIMFRGAADLMIQLNTQIKDNKMGCGLVIDKANDISMNAPQLIIGMSFDDKGLTGAWRAKESEFPELAAGRKTSPTDEIKSYLGQVGMATASEVAKALNRNRSNVSTILAKGTEDFVSSRVGREVHYGLRI